MKLILLLVALIVAATAIPSRPERGYPNIDGSDHNANNPNWGRAGEAILHQSNGVVSEPYFNDGISTFRLAEDGGDLPNPRNVSNRIFGRQTEGNVHLTGSRKILSTKQKSILLTFWGQFMDHDISLTEETESTVFHIDIPDDAYELWFRQGDETFELEIPTSCLINNTGAGTGNPAQFPNILTAWLDASNVYGSDDETADALRQSNSGYMLTGDTVSGDGGPLLPTNLEDEVEQLNDRGLVDSDELFFGGDPRVNENLMLSTYHTLMVREHNRYVDFLEDNGINDDEEQYQRARLWVMALLQSITAYSFLPHMIGTDNPLGDYDDYDDSIDPTVRASFSTAGFRFGHTLLNGLIPHLDENNNFNAVILRDAFFFPDPVKEIGITDFFRGCAHMLGEEFDDLIIDDVRNHLFGVGSGALGSDLMVRNLIRGRVHGIFPYNDARRFHGLGAITNFNQINDDDEVWQRVAELYDTVEDIELWVGMMAEDALNSEGVVGETTAAIILDQFAALRDGDYYWFENSNNGIWSDDEMDDIRDILLGDLIRWNTAVDDDFPSEVFERLTIDTTIVIINTSPASTLSSFWFSLINFFF